MKSARPRVGPNLENPLLSIGKHIEELAKDAALVDPGDLQGLVSLQDKLEQLASDVVGLEAGDLEARSRESAGLIEQIILRETEDVDSALSAVAECIEYAQKIADSLLKDEGGDGAGSAGAEVPVDAELLEAWLSTCADTLAEIEGDALDIESSPESAAAIDEIRRGIHTLKGECGVLSLGVAQRLLHEAESLIDQSTQADPRLRGHRATTS